MAVVVSAMCVAVLTELFHSGRGAGGRSLVVALRVLMYCIGAVGVILVGLAHRRLDRMVTSIARQFPPGQAHGGDTSNAPESTVLGGIDAHLQSRDERIRQLETELKDLRIQSQLSQRRERHTEAILYSLRDAVVVTDESGRLLMANEPAAQLFGIKVERLRRQPLADVVGPEHKGFVELLQRSRMSGVEATRREIVFTQPDGPHTFDTIVSCVLERGKVSGVVAVLHDISREKEISQMKSDFVSHVSHELKTPLASITAYSEMLADGEADDEETRRSSIRSFRHRHNA
jgi:PAS domain S-box-containing protein